MSNVANTEMERHRREMDKSVRSREVRAISFNVGRLSTKQLKAELRLRGLSVKRDMTQRQDRLLRAQVLELEPRNPDVPWYASDEEVEPRREQDKTSAEEPPRKGKGRRGRGRKSNQVEKDQTDNEIRADSESERERRIADIIGVNVPIVQTVATTTMSSTYTCPRTTWSASATTTHTATGAPAGEEWRRYLEVSPELRRHFLGNPTLWGIESVAIQYLQARAGLRNSRTPSPGPVVSSSQPTPLAPEVPTEHTPRTEAPLKPPQRRIINPELSMSQVPGSVHSELYRDGWNNGEGSSEEQGVESERELIQHLSCSINRLNLNPPKRGMQKERRD